MDEVARYREVFDYLQGCKYPNGADKNQKRSIRQRASLFELREGMLVLKGTRRQWIVTKEQQEQIVRSCHDDRLGQFVHAYTCKHSQN